MEIDGKMLPVKVSQNRRATRMTLTIQPGGAGLKVTMPPHVSDRQLDQFLARNRNWAAAKISRMPQPMRLEDGGIVLFCGREHRIVHLDRLRGVVEAKQIAGEPSLLVPGPIERLERRLVDFLKREARRELNEATTRHAASLGVRPKQIRITDTTSRWGSCSSTRTLSFSWRIIMAPPEVLDYLVAHEVAHLREMNHSPRFWALVEQICPQMKRHRAWLKRNGVLLHAVQIG